MQKTFGRDSGHQKKLNRIPATTMRINNLLKLKKILSKEAYGQAVQKYGQSIDKNPGPAAHRKRSEESAVSESILAGQEVPRVDGPVRVYIHTQRKHLPRDVCAVSWKAALDSVVSAGVLKDDNQKLVQEVIPTVSAGQEEYTEIIIERI
jgi:hypothetical protein